MSPKSNPSGSTPAAAPLSAATLTQLIHALAALGINIVSPHDEMTAAAAAAVSTAPPAPPADEEVVNDDDGTSHTVVEGKMKRPTTPVSTGPDGRPSGLVYPRAPAVTTSASNTSSATAAPPPASTSASGSGTAGPSSTPATEGNVSAPHGRASLTADGVITGFLCANCQNYNLVQPSKESYYVVTAGRAVGVFRGWHNVQPLVSGVPHATFKKYSSEAAAVAAFEEAVNAGIVIVLA